MEVTFPSWHRASIPSEKQEDLYTCFQAGVHQGQGWRDSGHWLPTCPLLLPQGRRGNWKNRTSAWREPKALREGTKDRPPDPRARVGVLQGLRKGVALARGRTAGQERNCGHTRGPGLRPLPSQDLGLPAGQWGTLRRPVQTPQLEPVGGGQV